MIKSRDTRNNFIQEKNWAQSGCQKQDRKNISLQNNHI